MAIPRYVLQSASLLLLTFGASNPSQAAALPPTDPIVATLINTNLNASSQPTQQPIQPINSSAVMDDGTTITTATYLPNTQIPDGGWPALVLIHGWGGDHHTWDTLAPEFAAQGYVVLTYDCRGFGTSGGQATVAGHREIEDLHQLMWNLSHVYPVNPNKIGVSGISYGGGHSFLAAAANQDATYDKPLFGGTHPKVAAVAPVIGWTDLAQALLPNDVLKQSYETGLIATGFHPESNNYDSMLYKWQVEGQTGVNLDDAKADMARRSVIHFAGQLTVPMYIWQGWKDDLFPVQQATTLYAAIKDKNPNVKLAFNGFGHAGAQMNADETTYMFTKIAAFFDACLKSNTQVNKNSGPDISFIPNVEIDPEVWQGPDQAKYFNTWPVQGVANRTLYLDTGNLSNQIGAGSPEELLPSPIVGNNDDPLFSSTISSVTPITGIVNQQTQGLTFTTYDSKTLSAPVEQIGPVSLHLWLSSPSPDAQITARMFDVGPDGQKTLVTRGAYRTYGATVSPQDYTFELNTSHHTFAAGHTVEIELSPDETPFYYFDPKTPSITIYHDLLHPSQITIPSFLPTTVPGN